MFPVREGRRYLAIALAALLIATQLVILSMSLLYHTSQSIGVQQVIPPQIREETTLEDHGEILIPPIKVEELTPAERIVNLAQKYKAEPQYLDYIIKVEKTFGLQPCELLALIAQESGFKPQTHMDGGSLSYSTTQMKMPTAKTAYMAITEYYHMEIPYPTDTLLREDQHYATFLAGGYLRYLQDTYQDRFEAYTAYNWGIGGRMIFYKNNGHFKSPYATKVANLGDSFVQYIGQEYESLSKGDFTLKEVTANFKGAASDTVS